VLEMKTERGKGGGGVTGRFFICFGAQWTGLPSPCRFLLLFSSPCLLWREFGKSALNEAPGYGPALFPVGHLPDDDGRGAREATARMHEPVDFLGVEKVRECPV
jgi:hypothetical protein